MPSLEPSEFVVVGAGAAGLMAARALARAGKRVSILEARDRCGGRIDPQPVEEFGYPAEGGAEFVHGAAALTRGLMREAGLSLAPSGGVRWRAADGVLTRDDGASPHAAQLVRALEALKTDLPVAEFLAKHLADPQYAELRRSITRMVEGYDAADPSRASTFALRDEWMGRGGVGQSGRIKEGYGAVIAFLVSACREAGVALHLGAVVTTIEASGRGVIARCGDGRQFTADAAILAIPLPLLSAIALPPAAAAKAKVALADTGFGNVVKLLFRFKTRWWLAHGGHDLGNLSFVISGAPVPTWWTQNPAPHAVLTGWLAGPRADAVAELAEGELVERGLGALAEIFATPRDRLKEMLVAARAINWGRDPFARGAYSYATPKTRAAQALLGQSESGVFFSGEALYSGPEMGTVEAAFASGWNTAQTILSGRG